MRKAVQLFSGVDAASVFVRPESLASSGCCGVNQSSQRIAFSEDYRRFETVAVIRFAADKFFRQSADEETETVKRSFRQLHLMRWRPVRQTAAAAATAIIWLPLPCADRHAPFQPEQNPQPALREHGGKHQLSPIAGTACGRSGATVCKMPFSTSLGSRHLRPVNLFWVVAKQQVMS
ncbi:MAG: hypothetical protein ACTFAK_03925 [Candidatus Electronema sp. VV]